MTSSPLAVNRALQNMRERSEHTRRILPLQFGLRTLLVAVFLVALSLGGYRIWRESLVPTSLKRIDDIVRVEVQKISMDQKWHPFSSEQASEILMLMRTSRPVANRSSSGPFLPREEYRLRITRVCGNSLVIPVRQVMFWMEDDRAYYHFAEGDPGKFRAICQSASSGLSTKP